MSSNPEVERDGRPYRYPGARYFDESSVASKVFYGRSDDTDALLYQVLADDFVVVFGSSGHGKSSLIRAGLLRPLREHDYFPVVTRLIDDTGSPVAAIMSAVKSSAAAMGVECSVGSEASLWHFFMTLELSREGRQLTPVLILDQFEELYTIVEPGARLGFADEFADLVRGTRPKGVETDPDLRLRSGKPQVKVVISIRGDFLFELESLPRNIPQIFDSRYRVLPLRRAQAEEAIVLPATDESDVWVGEPFEWSQEAIDEVLDFLCDLEGHYDRRAHVNPFVMQLLCQYAEHSVIDGELETPIASGWIQKLTGVAPDADPIEGFNRVLVEYYERCIKTAPGTQRRLSKRIRDLCERRLVSSDGYRLTLDSRSALQAVPEDVVEHLERERLLTSHMRGNTRYYELSHDGLVSAVSQARQRHTRRAAARGAALAVAAVAVLIGATRVDDVVMANATQLLSETARNENGATVITIGSGGRVLWGSGDGFASYDLIEDALDKVWAADSTHSEVAADLRVAAAEISGWFALGFDGGGVVHWLPPEGEPMYDAQHGSPVSAVAISADGVHVASGDIGGEIWFVDYSQQPARYSSGAAGGELSGLAFTLDGDFLASATRDGEVSLWDLSDDTLTVPVATLDAGRVAGLNVAFMDFGGADGRTLIVIRRAGPSWLVDVSSGSMGIRDTIGVVRQATLSPDRSRLMTMTQEGDVSILDLASGEMLGPTVTHGGEGNARWVTMIDKPDPTQPFVAATSRTDGTVRLWKGDPDGLLTESFVRIADPATRGLLARRDTTGVHALVTGSSDGRVKVYDLRTLKPLLYIP